MPEQPLVMPEQPLVMPEQPLVMPEQSLVMPEHILGALGTPLGRFRSILQPFWNTLAVICDA